LGDDLLRFLRQRRLLLFSKEEREEKNVGQSIKF